MQLEDKKTSGGYTLIELLIIVVIVAILSAIAAPSWLAFLTRQRLNSAQAQALSIMRDAQAAAKREKRVWEACFRENQSENKVEWSVHPLRDSASEICPNARWQDLIGSDSNKIQIDTSSASRSTLSPHPRASNIYRVQFNHKGWGHGRIGLGKITFMARNQNNGSKRCVFASTLLGAMRTDSDRGCNSD